MTAQVLDGEAVAARVRSEVAERVRRLRESGVVPGLGTILVGDDAPSARDVALKHADSAEVGIESYHEHLDAGVSQSDLHEVITRFNNDPAVHSILFRSRFPPASTRRRLCSPSTPLRTSTGSTRSTSGSSSWAGQGLCPAPRRGSSICSPSTTFRSRADMPW